MDWRKKTTKSVDYSIVGLSRRLTRVFFVAKFFMEFSNIAYNIFTQL